MRTHTHTPPSSLHIHSHIQTPLPESSSPSSFSSLLEIWPRAESHNAVQMSQSVSIRETQEICMYHLARRTSLVGRLPRALRRRRRGRWHGERRGENNRGREKTKQTGIERIVRTEWGMVLKKRSGMKILECFGMVQARKIIQRGNQRKWKHNILALHNLQRFKHNG